MCAINYQELTFDHLVIFEKDRTVFAAARENGKNQLRLFLLNEATGNIYTRNGRADSWEEVVADSDRRIVLANILNNTAGIPVYKINGNGPRAN